LYEETWRITGSGGERRRTTTFWFVLLLLIFKFYIKSHFLYLMLFDVLKFPFLF